MQVHKAVAAATLLLVLLVSPTTSRPPQERTSMPQKHRSRTDNIASKLTSSRSRTSSRDDIASKLASKSLVDLDKLSPATHHDLNNVWDLQLQKIRQKEQTPPSDLLKFHQKPGAGRYLYGHELQADKRSHLEASNGKGRTVGKYTYVDANGKLVETHYSSGPGGFKVVSNNLPKDTPEVQRAKEAFYSEYQQRKAIHREQLLNRTLEEQQSSVGGGNPEGRSRGGGDDDEEEEEGDGEEEDEDEEDEEEEDEEEEDEEEGEEDEDEDEEEEEDEEDEEDEEEEDEDEDEEEDEEEESEEEDDEDSSSSSSSSEEDEENEEGSEEGDEDEKKNNGGEEIEENDDDEDDHEDDEDSSSSSSSEEDSDEEEDDEENEDEEESEEDEEDSSSSSSSSSEEDDDDDGTSVKAFDEKTLLKKFAHDFGSRRGAMLAANSSTRARPVATSRGRKTPLLNSVTSTSNVDEVSKFVPSGAAKKDLLYSFKTKTGRNSVSYSSRWKGRSDASRRNRGSTAKSSSSARSSATNAPSPRLSARTSTDATVTEDNVIPKSGAVKVEDRTQLQKLDSVDGSASPSRVVVISRKVSDKKV